MTTKIPAELSSTPGISDSSDATAITITSAENVGIGTTSPETKVEISGSADNGLLQALQITNTDHASGETGQEVAINFKLSRAGTIRDAARITAGKDDDWDDAAATDSNLQFDTALNDTRYEQMRLTSVGNLHLSGGSDRRIQLGSGGAGANQVSNNTVHIRGDGTSMKLMAASGGELLYEQNGTERFRITSTGILRNTAGDGMVKIEVPAYITLADDSSVSIFVDTAGSSLVSVYEGGTGSGALVWLNFANSSGGNFLKSGGNSNFSSSDTDGQLCVIKSANSHTATIKNRLGSSIYLAVGVYGSKMDSAA